MQYCGNLLSLNCKSQKSLSLGSPNPDSKLQLQRRWRGVRGNPEEELVDKKEEEEEDND